MKVEKKPKEDFEVVITLIPSEAEALAEVLMEYVSWGETPCEKLLKDLYYGLRGIE